MSEVEQPDITKTVCITLKQLNIPFAMIQHAPAATMEDCRAVADKLGAPVCKNLFLCNRQKTDFYLLMLPADKQFKTKYLSEQIGSSRLSFADADAMDKLLHVAPGSASVFCLLFDMDQKIRLLIDADLMQNQELGCHPCINTATVRIAVNDLLHVFLPSVKHDFQLVNLPDLSRNGVTDPAVTQL